MVYSRQYQTFINVIKFYNQSMQWTVSIWNIRHEISGKCIFKAKFYQILILKEAASRRLKLGVGIYRVGYSIWETMIFHNLQVRIIIHTATIAKMFDCTEHRNRHRHKMTRWSKEYMVKIVLDLSTFDCSIFWLMLKIIINYLCHHWKPLMWAS